jgi:hypothetical protein
MKLRAPEGCASICHEGQIFVVEADGSIEVKKAMLAILAPHGFVPWDSATRAIEEQASPELVDIDALNRAGLFAFLRTNGIRASRRDTNEALRTIARSALGRKV